jgi:pimeloyl-ACP methyl ester carboxylesterase
MNTPQQQTAIINGKQLSYRDQGSGPVMVFIHGLAGNARSWQKQFEAFSDTHRVVAWDVPGFGKSDVIEPDVNQYARSLKALLDHLAINKILLTGHSMGGIVASRFAGLFPDHVRALVLSCTFWGHAHDKGEPLRDGYQARLDNLNSVSAIEYGKARAAAMLADGTPKDIIELAASIASETRSQGLENAARMLQESDTRSSLSALTMPTTVISGECDPVVATETTTELARLVPGSEQIVIPDAGHAPYLEFADAYNAALRRAFDL